MASKYLYEHGLPFSQCLAENLDDLKDRVTLNKAVMIIVDGGLGEGKTTIAVEMADYISGGEIDLHKTTCDQYAYGGISFQEKLYMCYVKKLVVLIYDEGDLKKRGALTRFNEQLNRTFQTFRTFRIIVIMCIPNFNVIDSDLFDNQIPRMLLHLHDRNEHQGNFSGYGLSEMYWLRHYMGKIVVKPEAYSKVFPNFKGHFLNLPPVREKLLDLLSTQLKTKELLKTTVKAQGLLTKQQMAFELNRSVPWIELKLRAHKIRPFKVLKNTNYYEKDVMGRLLQ